MPSTFVHALLPTACLFTLRAHFPALNRGQWLKLLFLSVILGNAPDLDIIPASIWYHSWEKIHREWGHNLFSICLMIYLGAWAIRRFVSEEFSARLAFAMAFSLVTSHLVLDSLHAPDSHGHLCGVPLLYPFTDTEFRLPWYLFPEVKFDKSLHFLWAHIVSRQFWHQAFFQELLAAFGLYVGYLATVVTARMTFRISQFRSSQIASASTSEKPSETTKRAA